MPVWLLCVVGVVCGAFVLLIVPHNLRVRRAQQAGRDLPPEERAKILTLIRDAGLKDRWGTLWIKARTPGDSQTLLTRSHVVGIPYAEAGDQWPTSLPPETANDPGQDDGESRPLVQSAQDAPPATEDRRESRPAPFLLQLRLNDPSLGAAWKDRLITIFLREDREMVVRVYKSPAPTRYVPLKGGGESLDPLPLEDLPIPCHPAGTDVSENSSEADELPPDFSPTAILARVRGLGDLLARHTTDIKGLLTQVLAPGCHGYDLDASSVIFEAGEPSYIQDVHNLSCPACKTRMRFLFQFGDVIPGEPLGDAGVGYVYGCDTHPDRTVCTVDSH